MVIDFGHGVYFEADKQPRTSNWHRRIMRVSPIPGTWRGHYVDLECGHRAEAFGSLHELDGTMLCVKCRDQEHRD